ncbi:MAG: ABC transporter permease [Acidobacteriota bacterium]|nr:ABC transporter permease [Acidobacteriota bacterium]
MIFLKMITHESIRPFTVLFGAIVVLGLVDRGNGNFLSVATAFSVLQLFSTLGLVSLALSLSLIVRGFDLSVAGMLSLAGCVAVLTGAEHPWLGLGAGLVLGLVAGILQGLIITQLKIPPLGVTLGGLLTFQGLSYALTEGQTIAYPHYNLALVLTKPIGGFLSYRSIITLGVFLLIFLVMSYTRVGRDVMATGSDQHASRIAGVHTDRILIGVFATAGLLTALAGVLLSYSLAAASPVALSDVLVPAAAAAIIGGVSLGGGKGNPLGVAAGVLTLCILRSGLNAVGTSPFVHEIVTGAVLLLVAILDAPSLPRRLISWRLRARRI